MGWVYCAFEQLKKVKKKHLFSCVFLRFCHTTSMKDKESTTPNLDQIIADAKARREQEQREHQEIMARINELKNNSIFAK
jgi:hypothetical protein